MKKPLRIRFVAAVILCVSGLFVACEQEADNPQWDIEILGPVLHAEIGINQLLADSLTQSDGDGKLRVVFESTYDNLETDSVYSISDTSIPLDIPLVPNLTIPAGYTFWIPGNLKIASDEIVIRNSIFEKGIIRLNFKNSLPCRLFLTYNVPLLKKDGNSIFIRDTVDGRPTNGSVFTTKEIDIDLAGTEVNLTGNNGALSNTLEFTLTIQLDPTFGNVLIPQDKPEFSTSLIGIEPYFIQGYFGQKDFSLNEEIVLGDGRLFQSGALYLDSARLSLDLENNIGADMSAYVASLTSINSATGNRVALAAPSILNQYINVGRASETGNPADPVSPSRASFRLDNSNSNLTAFLQNLPDRIGDDLRLYLNPLGNVSGNFDFIYKNRLIKTKTRLEIPLRLAADALTLVDTQDLSTTNLNDIEAFGDATFTLIAENGFPIDIRLTLEILDQAGMVSDQLLVPDLIPAGITDNSLIVVQPLTTRIRIPLDPIRKQHLADASRIIIRASFTTVDGTLSPPRLLDLYENYRLKLKLVADGTYSIR